MRSLRIYYYYSFFVVQCHLRVSLPTIQTDTSSLFLSRDVTFPSRRIFAISREWTRSFVRALLSAKSISSYAQYFWCFPMTWVNCHRVYFVSTFFAFVCATRHQKVTKCFFNRLSFPLSLSLSLSLSFSHQHPSQNFASNFATSRAADII